MNRTKDRRPGSGIIELIILIALPVLLHCLVPVKVLIPAPYTYLGFVPMLLGLALMTRTTRSFRKAGAGYQLQGESLALMTSGPFGFSRNPMYLGMLIWLVGLAVLLGSLVAFFFPALLFLLANWLLIPVEERRMEQLFGKQFIDYRLRVRRWL